MYGGAKPPPTPPRKPQAEKSNLVVSELRSRFEKASGEENVRTLPVSSRAKPPIRSRFENPSDEEKVRTLPVSPRAKPPFAKVVPNEDFSRQLNQAIQHGKRGTDAGPSAVERQTRVNIEDATSGDKHAPVSPSTPEMTYAILPKPKPEPRPRLVKRTESGNEPTPVITGVAPEPAAAAPWSNMGDIECDKGDDTSSTLLRIELPADRTSLQLNLTRQDTERLLMREEPGNFVIRPSNTFPDELCLSLRCNNNVAHLRLHKSAGFYNFSKGPPFSSLAEFVEYYGRDENPVTVSGQSISLRYPKPSTATESSNKYGPEDQLGIESGIHSRTSNPTVNEKRPIPVPRPKPVKPFLPKKPPPADGSQADCLDGNAKPGQGIVKSSASVSAEGACYRDMGAADNQLNNYPRDRTDLPLHTPSPRKSQESPDVEVLSPELLGGSGKETPQDFGNVPWGNLQDSLDLAGISTVSRVSSWSQSTLEDDSSDEEVCYDPEDDVFKTIPLYQQYDADAHLREFQMQHVAGDKEYADDDEIYRDPETMRYLYESADFDDDQVYEDVETVQGKLQTMSQRLPPPQLPPTDESDELMTLENSPVSIECQLLSTMMQEQMGVRRLWCDILKAKDPATLQKLTKKEIDIQEALFEILTSEAAYLKSLNLVISHFMDSSTLNPTKHGDCILQQYEFHALFSNILDVRKTSRRLMALLEKEWRKSCILDVERVTKLLAEYADKHFEPYVTYVGNQNFQAKMFNKLGKNKKFKKLISYLEKSGACQNQNMMSFLIMPMQRITRFPLLIEAVMKRVRPGEHGHQEVTNCLAVLQKIATRCNQKVKELDNLKELHDISEKLEFKQKNKQIALVSKGRFIVKVGDLQHLPQKSGLKQFMQKKDMLTLILLNDILLIVRKKSEKQYSVIDHSSTAFIHTIVDPHGASASSSSKSSTLGKKKYIFKLTLMHSEEANEYLLACNSAQERLRWTQVLHPNRANECQQTSMLSGSLITDETSLYSNLSCKQTQVMFPYTATQPDELSLKMGDVIKIIREMDDWSEGERIRDGERGWFPSANTEEIKSPQARVANLRRQQRLLQHALDAFEQQLWVQGST